jgi:uncharacterized membrane protein (Fun14 family)
MLDFPYQKYSMLGITKSQRHITTSINICYNFQLVILSLDAVAPTLFTIGSGGLIGFLAGFAMKRIFKILAVIVGLFFAALMYFQSQNLISVNWDRIQSMTQGLLSTLMHSLTDTGQISTITGNLGIPLTGGLAAGFAVGIMKG